MHAFFFRGRLSSRPSGSVFSGVCLLVIVLIVSVCSPRIVQARSIANPSEFSRPVIARVYEQRHWTLPEETPASVGAALAALHPSYVSGLVYIRADTVVSEAMIRNFDLIRSAVRARTPNARFDIEISLNPHPPHGRRPFASASALVAFMRRTDAQFHPDGWWFDFYSTAQKLRPRWIEAAVAYAHAHGQTVGGNVFNGRIPPGSDAIAFVDKPKPGSRFGFDFRVREIGKLEAADRQTVILGHLQSNPQHGPTTESCVYSQQWSARQRLAYLRYWLSQQRIHDFTFMLPVFYPLCPSARAFDPLRDHLRAGQSLFDAERTMMARRYP